MPHGEASSDHPPHTEYIERYCHTARLTLLPPISRPVYTQSHMDDTVEAILQVRQLRQMIRGMKIVDEAPFLRHFTARFEPEE